MPKPKINPIDIKTIAKEIEQIIGDFDTKPEAKSIGQIISVGDGVATIAGINDVALGEIIDLPQKTKALAFNLDNNSVGAVILGEYRHLKEGDEATTTGQVLAIPVDESLIGRIVNPLGDPLDGKRPIETKNLQLLEKIAPGVITRLPVSTPVQTGIKSIDSMIPIGRGQRELIIGDRSTGKSAIPLTTIINQKDQDLICIYVAIGQKASFVAQLHNTLKQHDAMDHTIIVAATSSDPASLQYLAPYAGCAIAEYFMEKGKDVLVVYDDLSKHAWAYREMSLLLKRPSGREAYPGDVFYLHSRLLERACRLNEEYGGGSITALPIVETQAGDVSAYIPTNIISITDGQIYLESDLFYSGIRPAVNVGLSVSRVGGSAQIKAMKQVAGKLRLDLAQYRELAAFAQFSSDLDPQTRAQLDRGVRITEILKQGWEEPMTVSQQIIIIWAVTNGFLNIVAVEGVKTWEKEYLKFMAVKYPQIEKEIIKEKKLSDKILKEMKKATELFNKLNPKLLDEKLVESLQEEDKD
ncbi:MAG: F0F1 ATP synthase subunit alpha [Candidatus Pacebacteria bacterium]|jgi:F-type H+/Na+-transporting ATPase subunit alpha|nr:F0F1 ATP synthase subunit alpha [Candidatus Paceibacterota bacterium]MBT3511706.1 F0F1 ATP synthase subunit alpha [Candidatus Paceibacterota bacterium]MBT4005135.1 F0F1 ATP synthase subunit alpha [Candidatus Paceibacterota bacterium]MBT4358592.1 F0F1 ATP synthase subunit alpha [Candidatus Paceibacterota bacterium]MBT4680732.1 F0F1 ATP synthase subunit alpha [Candidatus Paceibacterota bacterium]